MAPARSVSEVRAELRKLDSVYPELAIIKISESISGSVGLETKLDQLSPSKQRTSDASTNAIEDTSPASLEADLIHYKELFSKLRFSYLEQVTKEKYLRGIVGDPPLVVGHNDNVELEAQLSLVKAELQERKSEVANLIEAMETTSRGLASRYKEIQLQTTQLSELPAAIAELEKRIAGLRSTQTSKFDTGDIPSSQTLPLQDTLALLAEREAEMERVNRQLEAINPILPKKTREAEAMEREIAELTRRRNEIVARAKEAQRMRQNGESDGLEEMGRWYGGVERGLKTLIEP